MCLRSFFFICFCLTSAVLAEPLLSEVTVSGNDHVETAKILEVVSSRPGREPSEATVRRDLQAIYGLGYFTDVRQKITAGKDGGLHLEFTVQENPLIDRVEFVGAERVSPEELASRMESGPGQVLNFTTVANDRAVLESYYTTDLGWVSPEPHVSSVSFEGGVLTLHLQETFRVEDVVLEGVSFVDKDPLESALKNQVGKPAKASDLDAGSERITAAYEDAGYVLSGISHRIDKETGTLVYEVKEVSIEEVRVVGNAHNRTSSILRRLRTKPGQPLSPQRLRRDMRTLQASGLFRDVNPDFQAGEKEGSQILVLDVEEEKARAFVIGAGYQSGEGSSTSGLSGQISLSDQSLAGTGRAGSLSWARGEYMSTLSGSISDPAINDNGDGVGLTVYKTRYSDLQQSADADGNIPLYRDQRTGAVMNYQRPLSDQTSVSAAVRYEDITISQEADSPGTVSGVGQGVLSSLTVGATYDSTDDPASPTMGTQGSLTVTGGAGAFSYTRMQGQAHKTVPLGEKSALLLAAQAGVIEGYAPASELFSAGGPNFMRAYDAADFYGDRIVYGMAEYRFPLTGYLPIKGAVFAELGNAWYEDQPSKLAASSGLGLRIAVPKLGLGNLQVNYAWGREGGRFSLGVGRSF